LSADEWKAAYQALDAAARELHRLIESEADEDNPSTVCDYVLITGWMFVNDGDRVGGVSVFPQHGSQPAYITTGLLRTADASINRCNSQEDQ